MVFLYRLVENPCPKSYGIELRLSAHVSDLKLFDVIAPLGLTVASMANLGEGIIQRAREISHSFEVPFSVLPFPDLLPLLVSSRTRTTGRLSRRLCRRSNVCARSLTLSTECPHNVACRL